MTKFDLKKPVQTRDGRKARIVATDRIGKHSIVALIGEGEMPCAYPVNGLCGGPEYLTCNDLVNIPKRHTAWINFYSSDLLSHFNIWHATKEEADRGAGSNRLACVEVPWFEGQGLGDE